MKYLILNLIIILWMLLFTGCQERPKIAKTIPEAEAQVIVETARTEAATQAKKEMVANGFKVSCIAGMALAVGAIVLGQIMSIKIAKNIGVVALLTCGAGYGFITADIEYGWLIAIGGAVLVGMAFVYIFIVNRKALAQVVRGNERFKTIPYSGGQARVVSSFKAAQGSLQTPTTEKMVDKIRKESQ